MPYTYTLTSIIPATPQQIYQAWLDSEAHTEMTGAEAVMSDEVGAEVSAWDGYITGSNLELVPHERIVQAWRTTEFAEEHEDSIVTVMLEPVEEGTLLTLIHSNVPNEHRSHEEGGWESQYFEPMKAYFARLEQEEAADEPESQESAPESAPAQADRETVPAAPQRTRKAEAEQTQPPMKAAGAAKRKAKPAAGTKASRQTARTGAKRAGAKRAARRGAAKRAAKKQAAGRKAVARKAAPKKAAAKKATPKKAAPKKATAKKAAARKAGTKSKSSRRTRACR